MRSAKVASCGDVGSSIGGMIAFDGALRPDAVSAAWAVMDLSRLWSTAPSVQCFVGARLEFELGSASRTVALVGATPLGKGVDGFLGVFDLRPHRINGLPSYRMKGEGERTSVLLWHAGSYWLAGSMKSQKSDVASLRACDGALRPECVEATWEVWDERRRSWEPAPALRCVPRTTVVQAVEEVEETLLEAGARESGRKMHTALEHAALRRTASAVGRLHNQPRHRGGSGVLK